MAIMLALGFDPFVQNLLSYYDKTVVNPDQPAALVKVLRYGYNSYIYFFSPTAKSSIIAGCTATSGFDVPPYFCPSGDCTWSGTVTLGVCSRCADVSSLVAMSHTRANSSRTGSKESYNFTLPNGFGLDTSAGLTGIPAMNVTMNDAHKTNFNAMVFGNYTRPIALIHAIYADLPNTFDPADPIHSNTRMYAHECVLIPCVQRYNTSVGTSRDSQGSATTSFFQDIITDEFDTYDFIPSSSLPAGGTPPGAYLNPNDEQYGNETYFMADTTMNLATTYLTSLVPGIMEFTESRVYAYVTSPDGPTKEDSFFIQATFGASPSDICDRSKYSKVKGETFPIPCAVENIATGMTVAMRRERLGDVLESVGKLSRSPLTNETLAAIKTSPSISYGKTMVSKTYISVTWYWLALPLLLWVLAVVMLMGTVWKTRKAGIRTWRTSTLAPFFLGMGIGVEQKEKIEQHPMTAEGLERKAQEVKVQLHLTEQDARLVSG